MRWPGGPGRTAALVALLRMGEAMSARPVAGRVFRVRSSSSLKATVATFFYSPLHFDRFSLYSVVEPDPCFPFGIGAIRATTWECSGRPIADLVRKPRETLGRASMPYLRAGLILPLDFHKMCIYNTLSTT